MSGRGKIAITPGGMTGRALRKLSLSLLTVASMSGPKHLWAGDWESESGATPSRRAPLERPAAAPAPTPGPARAPNMAPPRARRLRVARIPRTAVLIAVAALVLAGAAYAVTSLPQSGSPAASATQPAWLGVQLIPVRAGALVAAVVPGSPAQAAGLRTGDVITQIQGRPVVSPINVTNAIDVLSPGQTVQLQVQRGPGTFTANATLAARPARFTSP